MAFYIQASVGSTRQVFMADDVVETLDRIRALLEADAEVLVFAAPPPEAEEAA